MPIRTMGGVAKPGEQPVRSEAASEVAALKALLVEKGVLTEAEVAQGARGSKPAGRGK